MVTPVEKRQRLELEGWKACPMVGGRKSESLERIIYRSQEVVTGTIGWVSRPFHRFVFVVALNCLMTGIMFLPWPWREVRPCDMRPRNTIVLKLGHSKKNTGRKQFKNSETCASLRLVIKNCTRVVAFPHQTKQDWDDTRRVQ